MKYTLTDITVGSEIFYNDDWAAEPYKFSVDAKAGDIVDGHGVVVYDVTVANNPNGAVAYRGVVNFERITEDQQPTTTQVAAFPMIKWRKKDGTYFTGKAEG